MLDRRFVIAVAIVLAGLAAGCVTRKGDEVSMPPWAEKGPKASDYRAVYPAAARRRQITGLVRLTCTIRTDRMLDCMVESEDPPGLGFGDAAIFVSHAFVVKTEKSDPRLSVGKVVHVPIHFALGD